MIRWPFRLPKSFTVADAAHHTAGKRATSQWVIAPCIAALAFCQCAMTALRICTNSIVQCSAMTRRLWSVCAWSSTFIGTKTSTQWLNARLAFTLGFAIISERPTSFVISTKPLTIRSMKRCCLNQKRLPLLHILHSRKIPPRQTLTKPLLISGVPVIRIGLATGRSLTRVSVRCTDRFACSNPLLHATVHRANQLIKTLTRLILCLAVWTWNRRRKRTM